MWSNAKAGIIKRLLRLTILILTVSLINGCKNGSEEIEQLREENKALRDRMAQLESQLKTGGIEEVQKFQIDEEALIFAKRLHASPGDFTGKEIKLQCEFWELSPSRLDDDKVYFSSTDYLGFIVRVTKGPDFFQLFIKKAKGDLLYKLNYGDPITIYGRVKSAYGHRPWIEVKKIETEGE